MNTDIWIYRSMSVSEQLHTYPSPDPVTKSTDKILGLILGQGRGKCAFTQILTLIWSFLPATFLLSVSVEREQYQESRSTWQWLTWTRNKRHKQAGNVQPWTKLVWGRWYKVEMIRQRQGNTVVWAKKIKTDTLVNPIYITTFPTLPLVTEESGSWGGRDLKQTMSVMATQAWQNRRSIGHNNSWAQVF